MGFVLWATQILIVTMIIIGLKNMVVGFQFVGFVFLVLLLLYFMYVCVYIYIHVLKKTNNLCFNWTLNNNWELFDNSYS